MHFLKTVGLPASVLFGSIVAGFTTFSAAAQAEECFRALTLDRVSIQSDHRTNLAVLSSIDQSRWNSMKSEADWASTFLGYGLAITSDMTYQQFSQERQKILNKWDYTYSESRSINYASQVLSDNARMAYVSCLKLKAHENPGVHVIAEQLSANTVIAKIMLNLPSGVSSAKLIVEHVSTSDQDKARIQNTLDSLTTEGEAQVTLTRDLSQDLVLTVNATNGINDAGSLLLVGAPPLQTPPPLVHPTVYEICYGEIRGNCAPTITHYINCAQARSGLEVPTTMEACQTMYGVTSYSQSVSRWTRDGDGCGYAHRKFRCVTPY